MTSYEELTPAMRKQVDAAIENIRNNVLFTMDQYQENYIREHMSNVVMTCLSIDREKPGRNILNRPPNPDLDIVRKKR